MNITLRADFGFFSQYIIKAFDKKGVKYSITAKLAGPTRKIIDSRTPDIVAKIVQSQFFCLLTVLYKVASYQGE